jgi:hypothetical protein
LRSTARCTHEDHMDLLVGEPVEPDHDLDVDAFQEEMEDDE